MIISSLTRTCRDPSGKLLLVPDHILDALQLKKETALYCYANSEDKELYFSSTPLSLLIGGATVLGANQPGVIADIATSFGEGPLNIVHFSSLAMGGFSITELVFECELASRNKGEFAAKCDRVRNDLQSFEERITDVIIQPLYSVIPIPLIQNPILIRTVAGNIPLIDTIVKQLGLEEAKEYAVLATSYARFPILVAKFFVQPEQSVRVSADIINEPKVLGAITDPLRRIVNIFSSTFIFLDQKKSADVHFAVGMTLFARFLDGMNKKKVEDALLQVNSTVGKRIIREESIQCRLISEITEGGIYD
jgi:predicted amino acid-binding ACT domain protein